MYACVERAHCLLLIALPAAWSRSCAVEETSPTSCNPMPTSRGNSVFKWRTTLPVAVRKGLLIVFGLEAGPHCSMASIGQPTAWPQGTHALMYVFMCSLLLLVHYLHGRAGIIQRDLKTYAAISQAPPPHPHADHTPLHRQPIHPHNSIPYVQHIL